MARQQSSKRGKAKSPVKQGSKPEVDAAHDYLRHVRPAPLESIFAPKRIALVGATEAKGSVGLALMQNLKCPTFGGSVFPINPKRPKVLGVKAYPNIAAVPEKIDLAVIVTPAQTVPGIIAECVRESVPSAIIISAGFKEIGPEGLELEKRILAEARRGRMRIVGPNCLGVMVPHLGLNATFAAGIARPGSVAFISQSGALCTAVLDWSFRQNVGFSAFVSIGSMLDVGWGDLINYLGDDPHTKSIVIYMESAGDARAFLSAAREVALTKPIIVIKVGRTEAAAKAAASHTGSMTGSDEVMDAAFRRVGVLRVTTIEELFDMAEVLGKQPRPKGPSLSIVTNAGGPGALATDMLVRRGGQLAGLSKDAFKDLNEFLPPAWSRSNPVDILGDAGSERYIQAVEIAAKDPNSDGLLVVLTPQAMTDSTETAAALTSHSRITGKPILASWMGGPEVNKGKDLLNKGNIPTFDHPDAAARAFVYMWHYSSNLKSLYETPAALTESEEFVGGREKAEALVGQVRKSGRTLLTEYESKRVLEAYNIPTVETRIATTENAAVRIAEKLDGPVVLKLHSETITHKTDVGGVHLNLRNATAVRRAWRSIRTSLLERHGLEDFLGVTVQPMIRVEGYELILGSTIDPQFGPVILFGSGGQLVEVFKDRALGLPPLNATLARRMMERTQIYKALHGVRGRKPVDLPALEQLLVRFSYLVAEVRWIKEIDINPLLVSPDRMIALDARVLLHPQTMRETKLPRLAIRPYPSQYVTPSKLKGGVKVTIRPIKPEDEPLMADFHRTLSERSIYYRYFSMLNLEHRIAHERLTRICFNDYEREIALVVERKDSKTGRREILGVGRLSKTHELDEAEFAIVVSDLWQGKGLGTQLLKMLVRIGRDENIRRITARILPDNYEMQQVCRAAGFSIHRAPNETECQAVIAL